MPIEPKPRPRPSKKKKGHRVHTVSYKGQLPSPLPRISLILRQITSPLPLIPHPNALLLRPWHTRRRRLVRRKTLSLPLIGLWVILLSSLFLLDLQSALDFSRDILCPQ